MYGVCMYVCMYVEDVLGTDNHPSSGSAAAPHPCRARIADGAMEELDSVVRSG